MARCELETSIERREIDGFSFPLGVYPIEPMTPRVGYTVAFESAENDRPSPEELAESESDFGSEAELEEWPDRYVFDILLPATRVESLVRTLLLLLPGRVSPILDVLGHDEYREVDPYVSYDLIGLDRFIDAIRRYRPFFYEDGMVGFGAMSQEPFLYVFVDEHKIVTVRAEAALKEKVEKILAAFDLEVVEAIAGADAATHEHRTVLHAPPTRLDLLSADEIIEDLQEEWRLELNINPQTNVDEQGNAIGICGWRCLVRVDPPPMIPEAEEEAEIPATEKKNPEESEPDGEDSKDDSGELRRWHERGGPSVVRLPPSIYAEVFLTAESLAAAQDLALQEVVTMTPPKSAPGVPETGEGEPFVVVLNADRLKPDTFVKAVHKLTRRKPIFDDNQVYFATWLE